MTKAHLLVTVDGLRDIIPEQALLDITNRAESTIAEELKRKLNQSPKFNVDSLVDAATTGLAERISYLTEQAVNTAVKSLKSRFAFPAEGREVIKELFKSELSGLINDAVNKGSAAAAQDLKSILHRDMLDFKQQVTKVAQEAVNTRIAELDAHIDAKARASFLDVLKEAKEAGL